MFSLYCSNIDVKKFTLLKNKKSRLRKIIIYKWIFSPWKTLNQKNCIEVVIQSKTIRWVIAFISRTHVEKIGNYNTTRPKADFRNSLSKTAIINFDYKLIKPMSKKAQTAQEAYSIDSTIFNNYYRLSKKDFVKIYGLDFRTEIKQLISDLKMSSFILEEDITVFRGLKKKKISATKLKEYKGLISTSLDEAIAIGYSRGIGEVIPIIVPKGTSVMYLRVNSIYPNHLEILIPAEYYISSSKRGEQLIYKILKR